MAPKQRMRIANEKSAKNVTMRGNVPKSSVRKKIFRSLSYLLHLVPLCVCGRGREWRGGEGCLVKCQPMHPPEIFVHMAHHFSIFTRVEWVNVVEFQ